MTVVPDLPDFCWPIDTSCCAEFVDYAQEVQDRATALAGQAMRALTGYQVGGCPITVRPCKSMCMSFPSWMWTGTTWMTPFQWRGVWVNSCGCATECSCEALDEVVLPAPVGRVDTVLLDGLELEAGTDYRVDGPRLVALGDTVWPTCQDMEAGIDEEGTFAVTYLNGWPVDGLGAYAAGVLACEFAKACTGGKCRLPAGVTDVSRAGVTYTIATGDFPGGVTGIREVDMFIARYNPAHLTTPSRVWFPGQRSPRVST